MDKIQKALIKAGRKDLAQEYFKKAEAIKHPYHYSRLLKPIFENIEAIYNKTEHEQGLQALGWKTVHEQMEKEIIRLQKLNQSLSDYYSNWKGYN